MSKVEEKYQFVTCSDDVMLMDSDNSVINLKKATGMLAMNLFGTYSIYGKEKDSEEKERLKNEITLQSQILNSLSNALTSIKR